MDQNQRLHRELLWAKFSHGVPVYMETATTAASMQPPEPEPVSIDESAPEQP